MFEMANSPDTGEASEVATVLTGNLDAFRAIVERHSHRLFRLAYRMTGNTQDAEELVQETFLRAYCGLAKFDGRSSVGTWLYRICVRCSLDEVRKRKTGAELRQSAKADCAPDRYEQASSLPAPDRLFYSAEVKRHVEAALCALSPNERAAFVLRHYEGLSIEEISAILGLGTSATKHAIFRGVKKLRRSLEPLVVRLR